MAVLQVSGFRAPAAHPFPLSLMKMKPCHRRPPLIKASSSNDKLSWLLSTDRTGSLWLGRARRGSGDRSSTGTAELTFVTSGIAAPTAELRIGNNSPRSDAALEVDSWSPDFATSIVEALLTQVSRIFQPGVADLMAPSIWRKSASACALLSPEGRLRTLMATCLAMRSPNWAADAELSFLLFEVASLFRALNRSIAAWATERASLSSPEKSVLCSSFTSCRNLLSVGSIPNSIRTARSGWGIFDAPIAAFIKVFSD